MSWECLSLTQGSGGMGFKEIVISILVSLASKIEEYSMVASPFLLKYLKENISQGPTFGCKIGVIF